MFQFVACCVAIDSRLKDLLVLGEARDVAAMRNIHMDPDTRALSAQLYKMRIMVCQGVRRSCWSKRVTLRVDSHAGRVRAKNRMTAMCFAGTPSPRVFPEDPRAALDEFEMLLRRHSALSGDDVSESLKVALVQKGITNDSVKTLLCCTPHALSNFHLVCEEVRSVLITRQALGQGPMPMDIGALDAKDKGKGKGKAEDKPDAEVTYCNCNKVGHRKADCWKLAGSAEGE